MKTSKYLQQLEQIITETEITSLTTYTIKGEEEFVKHQAPYNTFSGDLKSFGKNTLTDENQKRQNLIYALTNSIYSVFYCSIPLEEITSKLPPKTERDAFMNQLSKVNKTKAGFDYDWEIYNIDPTGNAFAKKNDELRWLQPEKFEYQDPNQTQAILNTKVNLVRPKESKTIQSVFYYVFSEEIFPQEVELCRFYWNLRSEGMEKLVELITTLLNSYKIPFQFKCLNHPELYVRADSAVLYTDKKYTQITSVILKEIVDELDELLIDTIPMFTQKLYKGVGYAEDPGKGVSFGMSRSSAIAESLVNSFLLKEDKKTSINSAIEFLNNKGMSIDNLHLNKHTVVTTKFPSYE